MCAALQCMPSSVHFSGAMRDGCTVVPPIDTPRAGLRMEPTLADANRRRRRNEPSSNLSPGDVHVRRYRHRQRRAHRRRKLSTAPSPPCPPTNSARSPSRRRSSAPASSRREVSEVIMGQILTAAQGQNPARQASIAAGIPVESPAWGVNQLCGSGLRAVALGYQAIAQRRLRDRRRRRPGIDEHGAACAVSARRREDGRRSNSSTP